jgi:hypothetical protein
MNSTAAVPGEKVIVALLEAITPIDERYLADALENVPLIKGGNVMVRCASIRYRGKGLGL